MHPLLPFVVEKLAAEQKEKPGPLTRLGRKIKSELSGVGSRSIERQELRKIKQQIRASKPKTEEEKRIEQLAGKGWTRGKFMRAGAIGAGMGTASTAIGSLIEGGKAARSPRALARGAVIGAMMGAAVPAATRLADIEAAKRGRY